MILILNLHTWSRTLVLHPHLHCLVTGVGVDKDDTMVAAKKRDYLLPTDVLEPIFHAKMRDALRRYLNRGGPVPT